MSISTVFQGHLSAISIAFWLTVTVNAQFGGVPHFCRLPAERGACNGQQMKWYFNKDFNRCMPFLFGGCQGNRNNFPSESACTATCSRGPTKPGGGGTVSPCATVRCASCRECRVNRLGQAKCVYRSNCCPTGQRQVQCFADPCRDARNRCPRSSSCVSVYCGSCRAIYYDDLLNELSPSQCSGSPTNNPCLTANCGPCSTCVTAGNTPYGYTCVPDKECEERRLCAAVTCLRGMECRLVQGRAQCVGGGTGGGGNDRLRACRSEKEIGTCRGSFPRYYHDPYTTTCKRFFYGGCGGNKNNFRTLQQCQQFCAGVPPCPIPGQTRPPPGCRYEFPLSEVTLCPEPKLQCDNQGGSRCQLPKVVGPCEAAIRSWFFNSNSRRCEQFFYGGCQGNANRFNSLAECRTACEQGPVQCPLRPIPRPPMGCRYIEERLPNGCPDYKLDCSSGGSDCASNPCGPCQKCVPQTIFCIRAPCPQFRCEDLCGRCEVCSSTGQCISSRVACVNPLLNPCANAVCPAFPAARCIKDECDCTKTKFVLRSGAEIPYSDCMPNSFNSRNT